MMSGPPPLASGGGQNNAAQPSNRLARLSLRRKLLYSVCTTVAFWGLLELALLALGVAPALPDSDPWVGFSGHAPLFVPSSSSAGPPRLVTAEQRRSWFNHQAFLRDKPPEAYRIFCLGGSTTYGRPYDDRTSFAGFLRAFLPAMDPSRSWEVINAGGISYASYRIEVLTRELVQYQPDLFVIYTGHNEFLEDRTYSSLIETPEAIRRAVRWAGWSRTFALAQRMLHGPPAVADRPTLPAEVTAILDRSVGPSAYHRDDRWRAQVLAHFRAALGQIVAVARNAGAEVLLVVPASNLRDCSPFKSEHQDRLTNEQLREFQIQLRSADLALQAGQLAEALPRLERAVQIDPRHADAQYRYGRSLIETGDLAAARQALVRARQEDVCPLRAYEAIQDIVRDIAAQWKIPLIDFAALLDRESAGGIPGADWFLDHVHPTIEGNQRLAREVAEQLVERNEVTVQPSWTPDAFQQVAQRVVDRIDPHDHAVALRNLAKVLSWAGKVEDADRLASQAAEHLADDAEAQRMAGFARLRRNETVEAQRYFEAALRLRGDDARALCGLGEVYTRLEQHEAAGQCFSRAAAADPQHVPAHFNLGNTLRTLGQLEAAEAAYRQALALAPDHPDAHKNLGLVRFAQGDIAGTVRHFEAALDLEDHLPQRHTDLGFVLIDGDDLQRADAAFQAALAIDPACVPAMFGAALVCERRKDLARAAQWLRDGLRVAPNDVNLHYYLARYALHRDDPATARSHLDTVLTLDPNHADARRLRAAID
jgi:tetratricopeptide (TPR) repeat protein